MIFMNKTSDFYFTVVTFQGLYRIRNVVGSENRHALIVMARGRTEDGQDFLIVQNSWKKSWGVNGSDDMRCLAFYPLM